MSGSVLAGAGATRPTTIRSPARLAAAPDSIEGPTEARRDSAGPRHIGGEKIAGGINDLIVDPRIRPEHDRRHVERLRDLQLHASADAAEQHDALVGYD
jgi:hypothetical protein